MEGLSESPSQSGNWVVESTEGRTIKFVSDDYLGMKTAGPKTVFILAVERKLNAAPLPKLS